MSSRVNGYCPMGCGRTLVLTEHGSVVCTHIDCPLTLAVSMLISDPETHHLVRIGAGGSFTVQHPLRERAAGSLLRCELHERLALETGILGRSKPGLYRFEEAPSANDAARVSYSQPVRIGD